MAAGTITITITDQWSDGHRLHIIGTFNPAAHYMQVGINFNLAAAGARGNTVPFVMIPPINGYDIIYVPGTDATDGVIKAYSTANTPLGDDGDWPAGLIGVELPFYAIMEQFI